MYRATADFRAVLQRLPLRVESGKCGQQTGMNVEDATAIGVNEFRGQHAHITGQANQINLSTPERRYYFTIVFGTRARATLNHERFNSTFPGTFKTGSGALIADHDCDLSIGNCSLTHGVRQRNHVRTAAGNENS